MEESLDGCVETIKKENLSPYLPEIQDSSVFINDGNLREKRENLIVEANIATKEENFPVLKTEVFDDPEFEFKEGVNHEQQSEASLAQGETVFVEAFPSTSFEIKEIEIEDLISAVKEHPEIWDCSREDYKNRNKKLQAWQAVSSALIANFEDKDSKEKNEIGKKIQTKWRYIKDAYAKSKRNEKNVKSSSSSKSFKHYVYSKSLEFLDGLQFQREVHESLLSGNPECSGTPSKGQHELQQPRKKKKTSQVKDELIKFMRDQGKQPEEDADRLFLLSLLPDVKSMSESQKRKFKIQIMQAIDDIKHPSTFYGNQERVGHSSYGYNHETPNNYNVHYSPII